MFPHTSPGTSGRHIVEELLWYDRFKFSDKLLASCINLSRVNRSTGQLVAYSGGYRIENTAGSSIMMGVDHVLPSFMLQLLKK